MLSILPLTSSALSTEFAAKLSAFTAPVAICLLRIASLTILVALILLSAMFAAKIVLPAIWSEVIWLSSMCRVKMLFEAIFVPSIACLLHFQ